MDVDEVVVGEFVLVSTSPGMGTFKSTDGGSVAVDHSKRSTRFGELGLMLNIGLMVVGLGTAMGAEGSRVAESIRVGRLVATLGEEATEL